MRVALALLVSLSTSKVMESSWNNRGSRRERNSQRKGVTERREGKERTRIHSLSIDVQPHYQSTTASFEKVVSQILSDQSQAP